MLCISAISGIFGVPICPKSIKDQFGVNTRGLTISQIICVLKSHNFESNAVAVDAGSLIQLRLPAIALIRSNHFVVIEEIARNGVRYYDPEYGEVFQRREDFDPDFGRLCVEVTSPPRHLGHSQRRELSLLKWVHGSSWFRTLAPLLTTTILAQAFSIGIPLLSRDIVDAAMKGPSEKFPISDIVIYAAITLVAIAAGYINSRVLAKASARLSKDLTITVLENLFSQPLPFFRRFAPSILAGKALSIDAVKSLAIRLLSSTVVAVAVGLASVVVLAAIAPILAVVALVFRATSVVIDVPLTRHIASSAEKRFRKTTVTNSDIIEAISAIGPVKAHNAIGAITVRIREKISDSTSAELELELRSQSRAAILNGLSSVEQMLLLAVGGALLHNQLITVGTLLAAQIYREYAHRGIRSLQDTYSEYQLVRLALARVEDIMAPPQS